MLYALQDLKGVQNINMAENLKHTAGLGWWKGWRPAGKRGEMTTKTDCVYCGGAGCKSCEIIEHGVRRFVFERTGLPQKGQWFRVHPQADPQIAHWDYTTAAYDILRELPAEEKTWQQKAWTSARKCIKTGCANDAEPGEMACVDHQHTVYGRDPKPVAQPGEAIRELAEKIAFACFGIKSQAAEDEVAKMLAEHLAPLLEKAEGARNGDPNAVANFRAELARWQKGKS